MLWVGVCNKRAIAKHAESGPVRGQKGMEVSTMRRRTRVGISLGLLALIAVALVSRAVGQVHATGEYLLFLPVVQKPCPAPIEEDASLPGSLCGPAIVQWFDSASNSCGITNLDENESFQTADPGHYWRFSSQEAMEARYPAHKLEYLIANPNCAEGQPHTPTPSPTLTPVPPEDTETPTSTQTPTETAEASATPTNTATMTATPSATATGTQVNQIVHEGEIVGVEVHGPSIVQWFGAASNSCGITKLDEGKKVSWGENGDSGYHWQFSSQQGMLNRYTTHKAEYLNNSPSCSEGNPPGWNPLDE